MRKIVAIATAACHDDVGVVPGYAQSVAARSGSAKAEVNPGTWSPHSRLFQRRAGAD